MSEGKFGGVCKHGGLMRSCEICDLQSQLSGAQTDCIRLQQEINSLRMEPCQLPACEKIREAADGLAKAANALSRDDRNYGPLLDALMTYETARTGR